MSSALLENRICLITGSSRGIGLGVARVFAENGASVILHGRDENVLR
ncbi:MAG: SDR family NAD(P)-dependent oxidoreductase, partial [Deltaproteobacteria bacterium]|nr:SDR family NAD(P)-dependent oxidoreductase [Deltaproteobacteria bacterium]